MLILLAASTSICGWWRIFWQLSQNWSLSHRNPVQQGDQGCFRWSKWYQWHHVKVQCLCKGRPVHKVHLWSKTVATKVVNLYAKSNFGKLFASNRDKFISLSDTKFDTCCHPEAILNRGSWNSRVVEYASEWDFIYKNLWNYLGYDNGILFG